ncbi:hypothetical protein CDAR_485511 [Caerostris darwini]|uniref:Uncharacterized protein n=1 Tax=Caerostris darwini TaxID=1538125 RepID=A0AAV4PAA8_9ARAC|nr:hypothetical protein CDAR_485511 [Caerostris darwini]
MSGGCTSFGRNGLFNNYSSLFTCWYSSNVMWRPCCAYFDGKPPWVRGLLYIVISIIPISPCASLSTIFGSGLIFVTGSLWSDFIEEKSSCSGHENASI